MTGSQQTHRHAQKAVVMFKLTLGLVRADAWIYGVILVYTAAARCCWLSPAAGAWPRTICIGQWTTLFLFSMPVVLLAIEAALAVYRNGGRQATAFRRVFSARCPSKVLDVAAEPLAMPLQEVTA